MDLLAGIRVLWDFVGEVQPAGVAVGIGFDGEQQVSEFGGVFLFFGEDGFYHRARGRISSIFLRKLMTYLLSELFLGRGLCIL